jgi:hypothetical protein
LLVALFPMLFWCIGMTFFPMGMLSMYGGKDWFEANLGTGAADKSGAVLAATAIQYYGFNMVWSVASVIIVLYCANDQCIANANLAFAIGFAYQAIEVAAGGSDWDNMGVAKSGMWANFGTNMALAVLFFLGVDYGDVKFSMKRIWSKLYIGLWLYVLMGVVFGLWMRFGTESLMTSFGFPDRAGFGATVQQQHCYYLVFAIWKGVSQLFLAQVLLLVFILFSGCRLSAYVFSRFTGFFILATVFMDLYRAGQASAVLAGIQRIKGQANPVADRLQAQADSSRWNDLSSLVVALFCLWPIVELDFSHRQNIHEYIGADLMPKESRQNDPFNMDCMGEDDSWE